MGGIDSSFLSGVRVLLEEITTRTIFFPLKKITWCYVCMKTNFFLRLFRTKVIFGQGTNFHWNTDQNATWVQKGDAWGGLLCWYHIWWATLHPRLPGTTVSGSFQKEMSLKLPGLWVWGSLTVFTHLHAFVVNVFFLRILPPQQISRTLLLKLPDLCGQIAILYLEQTHSTVTRLYLSTLNHVLLFPESTEMSNWLDILSMSLYTDTYCMWEW